VTLLIFTGLAISFLADFKILCSLYPENPIYGKEGGEAGMANENRIYVERRDDRRYAVRWGNSERASAIVNTQKQAIERARELNPGYAPHVERVRDTNKGGRDKWRKP
jgi:hypothetical protein